MVDIEHFGAVGDGSADDTGAIQHALDAGTGIVRLKKGTYRITRPLVVALERHGFHAVIGEGGAARIVMEGRGPAIRMIGTHAGTAIPSTVLNGIWERERFPTIDGIEIVGGHDDAVGIELRGTMQCVISRVLVRRCRHGIHLVDRNRNVVLANSHIYDNRQTGLFLDRCNLHQMNISGCHISYNREAGIRIFGGDVHNVQIVGNDIEYNNAPTDSSGQPHDGGDSRQGGAEISIDATEGVISEVTLGGNTIQATIKNGGANVRIHGTRTAAGRHTASLISITGNVIGKQWRAIEVVQAGQCAIVGNTLYGAADHSVVAIDVSGMTIGSNSLGWWSGDSLPANDGLYFERCDGVVVSGLTGRGMCGGSLGNGAMVTFLGCTACSVSDSQILDPVHSGIELHDCRDCRIANNTILDQRAQPTMQWAIRVRGRSRGNLVQGNVLSSGTVTAIEAVAASAKVHENLIASSADTP